MPTFIVTSPDGKEWEVDGPEGSTQEQAIEYIKSQWKPQAAPAETYDPTEGMSTAGKVAAGAGAGLTNLGRGARQILSNVPGLNSLDMFDPEKVQAEIDESRRLDAPLMDTTAGKVGNVAGMVIPSLAIPGASTALGATAVGAGMGALQPTSGEESRALNTVVGGVAGRAGKWAGDKLGGWVSNRLAQKTAETAARQSQDQVRNATLAAAQGEGYVVTPSQAGAGVGSRLLEGLSGKYKTEQLANIKNQKVTENIVRRALGLPKDSPITAEGLQAIRTAAYQTGYEPLKSAGIIATDKTYNAAMNNIASKYAGAARSFPDAVKSQITDLVDSYKVKFFDASDAMDAIKILREDASSAFRQGDNALGKASREIAKALEDKIERQLSYQGKDSAQMLKNFRDARVLMAKTHTVEDALQEGGGMVDPQKFARMLQRGEPLSGDLKKVAEFSNVFKEVSKLPKSGDANPLTVLDYATAGLGYNVNPATLAIPAARVAARYGILSQPYQKALVSPQYPTHAVNGLLSNVVNSRLLQSSFPGLVSGVALNWGQ